MSIPKLVVLGGSSPFTLALLNELRNACDRLPRMELVLHGRSRANLGLVKRYADDLLDPVGWRIRSTAGLEDALPDARIVIHQIRYGGLKGREAGEAFCSRYGLPADETLGAAALLVAIRSAPSILRTRAALVRHCPEAWLLNLTNPLSAVTGILTVEPGRTLGLCELPQYTARSAARAFGLPIEEIDWEYTGFNHRGFIVSFRHGPRDLIRELPRALGSGTIEGVTGGQIAELHAIPLKYYKLLFRSSPSVYGRSRLLRALRRRLIAELRVCWTSPPPSLAMRNLSWYRDAVIPAILALNDVNPATLVVNVQRNDLVEEVRARVSEQGVSVIPCEAPDGKVGDLLFAFRQHEQAFFRAMLRPSHETISQVLAADPTLPGERVDEVSAAIWSRVQRVRDEPGVYV